MKSSLEETKDSYYNGYYGKNNFVYITNPDSKYTLFLYRDSPGEITISVCPNVISTHASRVEAIPIKKIVNDYSKDIVISLEVKGAKTIYVDSSSRINRYVIIDQDA